MSPPVEAQRQFWLWTEDGVAISARHDPGAGQPDLGFVVVHGFTGHADRPAVRAIVAGLRRHGGVVSLDLRGHGRSGGLSSVGQYEVLDLAAAVGWARALGYRRLVTVGWSLGATVVLQHGARHCGEQAVVAVSGPSRWYYRGTRPMWLLHHAVTRRTGRWVLRTWFRTRVDPARWDPVPEPPDVVVARIAPVPLLLVHGDADHYFPLDHPRRLAQAAGPAAQLWIEPGFGHAENSATPALVDRIGAWADRVTSP